MAVRFAKAGLGYSMADDARAVEFEIQGLQRRHGDWWGMLSVSCALPGVASSDGRLHYARHNLSSGTSRASLARSLRGRATLPDLDWDDLLEQFCRQVLAAQSEGEPVVRVGTKPAVVGGVSWRLDPIMPVGKPVILYGEGGTGKSTLAVAMAISIEMGVSVIEHFVPRRAPVLYLDWEADEDELNERVRAVGAGANLPTPAEIAYRPMSRPLADSAEEVAGLAAEMGAGAVFVDSVQMASGMSSDGSDAAESAVRLFTAFRLIATASPGCSILAVDHVSKAETEVQNRSARPYGSIFKWNLARALFEVRRVGDVMGLYNTKSNLARLLPPIALRVDQDEHSIRYERLAEMPADLTRPMRMADQIAWALREGHLTTEEIADKIESQPNSVRSMLSRHKDRFHKLPSGAWELLPEPHKTSAAGASGS